MEMIALGAFMIKSEVIPIVHCPSEQLDGILMLLLGAEDSGLVIINEPIKGRKPRGWS